MLTLSHAHSHPIASHCIPSHPIPSHAHPIPTPQGILREGLEDVAQFFKAHGSCRLPLSPSLLVKGIVPRVSATPGGLRGLLCPLLCGPP